MLAKGILQLLGIVALSFLVTPFILYSIGMVTALLVLVAMILLRLTRNQSLKTFPKVFKRFVWMKHDIEKEHSTGNYEIHPPDSTHNIGVCRKKRWQLQPVPNLERCDCCEEPFDDLRLYGRKYPIINLLSNKLNSVLKGFHRLVLFYRSYYGYSTKVEKNRKYKNY